MTGRPSCPSLPRTRPRWAVPRGLAAAQSVEARTPPCFAMSDPRFPLPLPSGRLSPRREDKRLAPIHSAREDVRRPSAHTSTSQTLLNIFFSSFLKQAHAASGRCLRSPRPDLGRRAPAARARRRRGPFKAPLRGAVLSAPRPPPRPPRAAAAPPGRRGRRSGGLRVPQAAGAPPSKRLLLGLSPRLRELALSCPQAPELQ